MTGSSVALSTKENRSVVNVKISGDSRSDPAAYCLNDPVGNSDQKIDELVYPEQFIQDQADLIDQACRNHECHGKYGGNEKCQQRIDLCQWRKLQNQYLIVDERMGIQQIGGKNTGGKERRDLLKFLPCLYPRENNDITDCRDHDRRRSVVVKLVIMPLCPAHCDLRYQKMPGYGQDDTDHYGQP